MPIIKHVILHENLHRKLDTTCQQTNSETVLKGVISTNLPMPKEVINRTIHCPVRCIRIIPY